MGRDGVNSLPKKPAPCPICGRPSEAAFTPFCSARCADIDLGRWLSDRYVIPGEDEEEIDPPQRREE
ncbi:DNA gyrase inhibitor YacG [Methylobacterium durans]|uniref:DNA gyrase inhibitor YacG n=1 Tax=Methylobacterium durans TaxID=2202825 RepID=UPI003C6DA989